MVLSRFKLFRKRTLWFPTWRSVLIAAILFFASCWFLLTHLHGFLAQSDPREDARIAIVEGWLADSGMEVVADAMKSGRYDIVYTTGCEIGRGGFLAEYRSLSRVAEASLEKLGVPEDQVIPAPSSASERNRTYEAAANLYRMLKEQGKIGGGLPPLKMSLVSEGAHTRRSLLVFRKVFGDDAQIGSVVMAPLGYDPDAWWKSSAGAKGVMTESIAWLYEWLWDSGRH